MSNVKKVLEPDSLVGHAALPESMDWRQISQDMAADGRWGAAAWIQKGTEVSSIDP